MVKLSSMRSGSLLTVFAAVTLLSYSIEASAEWPATQFQVQTREPVTLEKAEIQQEIEAGTGMLDSLFESVLGSSGSERPLAAVNAEQWLNEIGAIYRKGGHKAPYIEPIVQDNGTARYRVYIFPFGGSRYRSGNADDGGGYQTSDCAEKPEINWVSFNADKFSLESPLPKRKYWTLSHEMFHALQYGDQLMANCFEGGMWIREGLADGAALYLINKKFPNFSGHIEGSSSAVGLRHYDWPLNFSTGRKNIGAQSLETKTSYLTSSFWRFLPEYFGGVKVLPHLLEKPLARDASEKDLLRWLDERLRTEPNIQTGLYLVYPHFVTEFASYGGSRYTSFDARSFGKGKAARMAWLKEGFSGCQEITLTPNNAVQKITVSVNKVAAICIRVQIQGFSGNVTEQIEIVADRLDLLDQLHLGWAWIDAPDGDKNCYEEHKAKNSLWPPCVIKPFSQTGPAAGNYARTWAANSLDFGESSGTAEHVYILSNVAEQPWKTKDITGYAIKIGIASSTLNGGPAEPVGPLPAQRKTRTKNPLRKIGRDELYGLQTDPTIPDDTVKGFSVLKYAPNRSKGAKAVTSGGYAIQINKLDYKQTGPVTGIVALEPDDPRNQGGSISSIHCKGAVTRPIGTVTQSDENAFRISIDTDLCQAGPQTIQQCAGGGCPVVDHASAKVTMAFGWRQFNSTAPTDIRTAGIQRYIETMPNSLEEGMRFGANSAIPDTGQTSGNGGEGDADDGTSNSAGATVGACACTCEELAASDARGAELKARVQAGDKAAMARIIGLNRCTSTCQREYMICRLGQSKAEADAKKKALSSARGTAQSCDCSCEALAATDSRAKELQSQFAAGSNVPRKDIISLTRCAEVCRDQHMACRMQQYKSAHPSE